VAPTQGRISVLAPAITLRAMCGSAMWARVMPTMSSLPAGDGVAGGGHVGDARGVEDREAGRGAHLAGEVEMRRGGHALDRDDVGQRRVGVDVAADDVEEVDLAGADQAPRDLDPSARDRPLLPVLVGDHADADDEVGADGGAHRVQHRER
jgi:hypothetical protein